MLRRLVLISMKAALYLRLQTAFSDSTLILPTAIIGCKCHRQFFSRSASSISDYLNQTEVEIDIDGSGDVEP